MNYCRVYDRTGRCLNIISCKHRESLRANLRILRLVIPPRDPISWIQHIPPGFRHRLANCCILSLQNLNGDSISNNLSSTKCWPIPSSVLLQFQTHGQWNCLSLHLLVSTIALRGIIVSLTWLPQPIRVTSVPSFSTSACVDPTMVGFIEGVIHHQAPIRVIRSYEPSIIGGSPIWGWLNTHGFWRETLNRETMVFTGNCGGQLIVPANCSFNQF